MSLHDLDLGDENARIPMTKPLLKLYEVGELLPAVLAASGEVWGDPVQN
jgi:hypothetical protein